MPANHSSRVRPTSSTKAWRCLTAAFMISTVRGLAAPLERRLDLGQVLGRE